ncbi:MAG TPA: hypothetical protein VKT78_10330 [Fimbriimonadaceae bacterium]|nr:hypothetical protein [Fimbriimonadaceae bacterium]
MNEPSSQSHEDHGQDTVHIQMDGKNFPIHRGRRSVSEIKAACHVNPNYVIEEISESGQPTLLDDAAFVTIKGGERFISHVRGGGSS